MRIFQSPSAQSLTAPALSILIPYYRDDPSNLLKALMEQIEQMDSVEILLYDDGTGDEDINNNLQSIANNSRIPINLYFAQHNKGRSAARNKLKDAAKAKWVLFLDADMLPQTDSFIDDYLAEIKTGSADIIFGGFTVPPQKQSSATELHRVFSQTSDCLSAKERRKYGPQYICSSNLCVRANVLKKHNFSPDFIGWGWEDSEWAARVAALYTIYHADIPALHLGLESTETLLSRFKTSGNNYLKFTNAHPNIAQTLTLYKMINKLKNIPGQKLMRPLLAALVRAVFIPIRIRLFALKLWRVSWYTEAFS